MGFYGRLQQDGRIESFDVALLDPHAGLGGYIALRGTADQMAALRQDEEFRRLQADVSMIIDDLRVIDGFCGDGIAREIGIYQDAVAKVPQRT